jgi:hypothetical protein
VQPDLTETVQEIIRLLFPPDQRAEVAGILAQRFGGGDAERCCLAALKLSNGDLGCLRASVKDDYRDLLMAAGFGFDLSAHESWATWVKAEQAKDA